MWAKIGVLSFGGRAGQIALMHRILVDERKWIAEDRFLHALNFCMLLPGPEAMQLATYVGWRLHGTLGGLAAGLLFVLPGAFVVLALEHRLCVFRPSAARRGGCLSASRPPCWSSSSRRCCGSPRARCAGPCDWAIAAAAFVAIFFFAVPFPLDHRGRRALGSCARGISAPAERNGFGASRRRCRCRRRLRIAALWLAIWIAPLLLVAALFGRHHVYHRHRAVLLEARRGDLRRRLCGARLYGAAGGRDLWLAERGRDAGRARARRDDAWAAHPRDRIRGLPRRLPQGGEPTLAFGLLGAAVTLWATFAPCFLWIFVGAPYIERLSTSPRLAGALAGVTAAVVGVILNLSLWFALHVLFGSVTATWHGPCRSGRPSWRASIVEALALCLLAAILLLGLRCGIAAPSRHCRGGARLVARSQLRRGLARDHRLTKGARTQVP